jgi:NAD-specific glutamate dehydrogenase
MLRSDVLKDLYERNELLIQNKDQKIAFLENELSQYSESSKQVMDLANEAKINHASLQSFSLNRAIIADILENRQDTILMAYAKFKQKPSDQEMKRFKDWLKVRTKVDTVSLIIQ